MTLHKKLKSIFNASDYASDVQADYRTVLSVGKTGEETEKILFSYYRPEETTPANSVTFWLALAYAEWEKGRLSPYVQERALHYIDAALQAFQESTSDERPMLLQHLRDILISPQPEAKKLRKPTVHHCPWKVGSLLAYRIVSNEQLKGHPCFLKYALLRVVKIDRRPVSRLVPTELYNESMRVSLYGWIGDEIPNPEIVKQLDYIPIFLLPREEQLEFIPIFRKPREDMWVYLDWLPTKYERGDLTLIGCDDDFENHIPSFLDFNACPYILTHFLPFDITLSKRLLPYLPKDERLEPEKSGDKNV